MAKRQVFFSFEYNKDNWRAAQVRNMGKVDNTNILSGNEWEHVKRQSDTAIKNWINEQIKMRSCTVVLVGSTTASRRWVQYEIQKSYELHKGIVGIYINLLKDKDGYQTVKGDNPFTRVRVDDGSLLSRYVQCYTPTTFDAYNDISKHLSALIEKAIADRFTY